MNLGLGHHVRCQCERELILIRDQDRSPMVKASMGNRGLGRTKSAWGFATDEIPGVHRWVSRAAKETQGAIWGPSNYNSATIPSVPGQEGCPCYACLGKNGFKSGTFQCVFK